MLYKIFVLNYWCAWLWWVVCSPYRVYILHRTLFVEYITGSAPFESTMITAFIQKDELVK